VVCSGQSATLLAGAANGYTWHGIGGGPQITVSPTVNTTYTLTTVTSSGNINCEHTQVIPVNVYPETQLTIAATRTTMCRNETTTITVNGASTYTWVQGGSNSAVYVYTATGTGNYTLVVNGTDANGCATGTSIRINVTSCSGLSETSLTGITVYPNPTRGSVFIERETDETVSFTITDIAGRMVKQGQLSGRQEEINISREPAGVYFVRLKSAAAEKSVRIVKE
jgi:hypothetical protein